MCLFLQNSGACCRCCLNGNIVTMNAKSFQRLLTIIIANTSNSVYNRDCCEDEMSSRVSTIYCLLVVGDSSEYYATVQDLPHSCIMFKQEPRCPYPFHGHRGLWPAIVETLLTALVSSFFCS
jgi:hypothetical protein